MEKEEFFKTLIERVDAFKGEVEAVTEIAAEVEKEARAAIAKATTAESKAKAVEDITVDAIEMAYLGLSCSFIFWAASHPKKAREVKDAIVEYLEEVISNRKILDVINKGLTKICDKLENKLLKEG